MTATLSHYTITTGHLRESPRSEVSDEVIAALAPLLVTGEHAMPHPPGYSVRVTLEQGVLAATVSNRDGMPLVTMFVCVHDVGLLQVCGLTGAKPAYTLALPALLVETHPALAQDHDAIGWLPDFERCLAWTFVERP